MISKNVISLFLLLCSNQLLGQLEGLPVLWWKHPNITNFGDILSVKLVERILGQSVREYKKSKLAPKEKKLLAIGSIISFADQGDVIWGSGIKRRDITKIVYRFTDLDVRAVRGPLSRDFLIKHFNIKCPEIYGDPALLIPLLFPEFKRKKNPIYEYLIIPHYSELLLFPKDSYPNVVYPTEPWDYIIRKICDSKFVISSSLHGIIVAEAFGIPARMLRVTKNQPLFKFKDYYYGTNRFDFKIAHSIQEALQMGGEKPVECDIKKLYEAFPFEFWPNALIARPNFNTKGDRYEYDEL